MKRLVKNHFLQDVPSKEVTRMIETWYVIMSNDDVYRILRNKLVPGFWEFRTKLSE